jgi:hypothetical protein
MKKGYLIVSVLIMQLATAPLCGMFDPRRWARVRTAIDRRVTTTPPQIRTVSNRLPQRPVLSSSQWIQDTWSSLRNSWNNLWYGSSEQQQTPVQQYSPPSQIPYTMQERPIIANVVHTSSASSTVDIKSDDELRREIEDKLKATNPWNDNTILNDLMLLLKQKINKNDDAARFKYSSKLEFVRTILVQIPSGVEQHQVDDVKKLFFDRIGYFSKLDYSKKNKNFVFTYKKDLTEWISFEDVLGLLPNDSKKCIDAINALYKTLYKDKRIWKYIRPSASVVGKDQDDLVNNLLLRLGNIINKQSGDTLKSSLLTFIKTDYGADLLWRGIARDLLFYDKKGERLHALLQQYRDIFLQSEYRDLFFNQELKAIVNAKLREGWDNSILNDFMAALEQYDKPDLKFIGEIIRQGQDSFDRTLLDKVKEKFFDKIMFKYDGSAADRVLMEWLIDNQVLWLLPKGSNCISTTEKIYEKLYRAGKAIAQNSELVIDWYLKKSCIEGCGVALSYYYRNEASFDEIEQSLLRFASTDYKQDLFNYILSVVPAISGLDSPFCNIIRNIVKKNKNKFLSSLDKNKTVLYTYLPEDFFVNLHIDDFKGISSYCHLEKYFAQYTNKSPIKDVMSDVHLQSLVRDCFKVEKEFGDKYEIFYHGRRWQYAFLADIYGLLYSSTSGKKLQDFIFVHLDDPATGKVSEKFMQSEQDRRERLVKEGNIFSHDTKGHPVGIASRQSLLFLNKFLFGNLGRLGSNSMDYIVSNHNVGNISFSIAEIFSMFGLFNIYQQYADALSKLKEEHDELTQYGELLQILIPKDTVDKTVYYTTSGGPRKEYQLSDGTKTTDTKTILKDIDEHPVDVAEFVGIVTNDKYGLLNPDSGVKIYSRNVVDPQKMALFREKEKQLFDRIKQSIAQPIVECKVKQVQEKWLRE